MTDRIKLHIPIQTPEQIVIRDEVARQLAKQFPTILKFSEMLKDVKGEMLLFPISIVEVYIDNATEYDLNYFKELTSIIASKIGDSVTLEITKESIFIGTAQP